MLVSLKYLFLEFEFNFVIVKYIFKKILCKYRQVWSYFEDLTTRKIMVQFKFNLDVQFNIYIFLISDLYAYGDIIFVVFSACIHPINLLFSPTIIQINEPAQLRKIFGSGEGLPNHHLKRCIAAPACPQAVCGCLRSSLCTRSLTGEISPLATWKFKTLNGELNPSMARTQGEAAAAQTP